jgi:long-subunit acyl-CoA synthetase (AMP-forming)
MLELSLITGRNGFWLIWRSWDSEAADVPRGSDSTKEEIAYILQHAGCEVVFCENKEQQKKIVAGMGKDSKIRILIHLDDGISSEDLAGDKRIQLLGHRKAYRRRERPFWKKLPRALMMRL